MELLQKTKRLAKRTGCQIEQKKLGNETVFALYRHDSLIASERFKNDENPNYWMISYMWSYFEPTWFDKLLWKIAA